MHNGIVEIQLLQFALVYLLLLVVLAILKKGKVDQTKLLLLASLRMSLQLMLAGYILTYIFQNPHPALTIAYVVVMIGFAVFRVLNQNRDLNARFKLIIALSISASGLFVLLFVILVIIGESPFNPQYVIPISGMLIGNTMNAVSLAVRTFRTSLDGQRNKIVSLLNIGARPQEILLPFVRQAVETALLPTLNSMLGMGIVSLPGMMTGQILSGTLPTTAILYQIVIMIAITTVNVMASFGSLHFGHRTLWNQRYQITL